MAVSWMGVFKVIPWRDVIENAPTVVRGARKLWGLVGGAAQQQAQPPAPATADPDTRIAALERELARQNDELKAAANLLSTLAEQNERLIEAVEILRLRTRVLLIAGCVLAVGFIALGIAWFR